MLQRPPPAAPAAARRWRTLRHEDRVLRAPRTHARPAAQPRAARFLRRAMHGYTAPLSAAAAAEEAALPAGLTVLVALSASGDAVAVPRAALTVTGLAARLGQARWGRWEYPWVRWRGPTVGDGERMSEGE